LHKYNQKRPQQMQFSSSKCIEVRLQPGWSFALDPTGGAHSTPRPLSWINGGPRAWCKRRPSQTSCIRFSWYHVLIKMYSYKSRVVTKQRQNGSDYFHIIQARSIAP